jgi:cob(I)alamin adenosyltransferase
MIYALPTDRSSWANGEVSRARFRLARTICCLAERSFGKIVGPTALLRKVRNQFLAKISHLTFLAGMLARSPVSWLVKIRQYPN